MSRLEIPASEVEAATARTVAVLKLCRSHRETMLKRMRTVKAGTNRKVGDADEIGVSLLATMKDLVSVFACPPACLPDCLPELIPRQYYILS